MGWKQVAHMSCVCEERILVPGDKYQIFFFFFIYEEVIFCRAWGK